MKYTKYLFFLFICLFLNACSDDKNEPGGNGGGGKEEEERPEVLAWIEDTMREHYYWYKDMPLASKLTYKNVKPNDFFYSLLSSQDRFSSIEDLSLYTRSKVEERYSYGIEFTGVNFGTDKAPKIYVLICYVVPGSPADEAGLKRGDWIMEINGKSIDSNIAYASLWGGGATKFTLANRVHTNQGDSEWDNIRKDVAIAAARPVEDNPVHVANIIERGDRKIGYMLYNHFTSGTDKAPQLYDNTLREKSVDFKAKGVNEFILDLRYNGGGELSCAMVLCAILAPQESLGKIYGYLRFNDKQKDKDQPFGISKSTQLEPKGETKGENLNFNKVYVLTSSSSASASEMIINSLRVFMDVTVIGEKTVGKNVGSISYPTDREPYPYGETTWAIHPIVCQISNTLDFTDYADGFKPGTYKKGVKEKTPTGERVYIDEAFELNEKGEVTGFAEVHPLGEENERMLKVALDMIAPDPNAKPDQSSRAATISTKTYKKLPNSIDRKATNGVIIDID